MPTVNRETLRTFLAKHAKDPARVPGAMELLEPFFGYAEAGRYALAPASELDQETVKTAIAMAIGRPVTKAIFVSHAHPFPRPDWMTEHAYRASITSLRANIGDSLWNSLGPNIENSLGAILGNSLGASIGNSLGTSLWRSLGTSIGDSLRDSFWHSIGDSLLYFLCFVILNDAEKIERLTPLIQLLPRAIPLGEKQDEPGTWLVLVA